MVGRGSGPGASGPWVGRVGVQSGVNISQYEHAKVNLRQLSYRHPCDRTRLL